MGHVVCLTSQDMGKSSICTPLRIRVRIRIRIRVWVRIRVRIRIRVRVRVGGYIWNSFQDMSKWVLLVSQSLLSVCRRSLVSNPLLSSRRATLAEHVVIHYS